MTSKSESIRQASASFYDFGNAKAWTAADEKHRNIPDMLSHLVSGDDFRLLDIGCGGGRVTTIVKDHYPSIAIPI